MNFFFKSKSYKIISIMVAALFFALWCPSLVAKAQINNNNLTLEKLELFASVFYHIRENYVDETDDEVLIQSALNSALNSLDPHSGFSSASDFLEQKKNAIYNASLAELHDDQGLQQIVNSYDAKIINGSVRALNEDILEIIK